LCIRDENFCAADLGGAKLPGLFGVHFVSCTVGGEKFLGRSDLAVEAFDFQI
jgi:hypothetical protein